MTTDPATVAQLVYDHRASIVGYLNDQANAFEVGGQRDVATALRAQASNVAIKMDIRAGGKGIASPVDAIVLEVCALIGGTNHGEVVNPHNHGKGTVRARTAAVWIAKKKLASWTEDQIANGFNYSDRSAVSKVIRRAEEIRAADPEFRRITDVLIEERLRCKNCQYDLLPG
jgi:hypothetical protein